jgi:hypothetical protein
MDTPVKFLEKKLPPIGKFYSLLNNEHVDKEEYKTAQKIWDKFNIKNLQEFNNLYNKVDIILIADIMENFRNIALIFSVRMLHICHAACIPWLPAVTYM